MAEATPTPAAGSRRRWWPERWRRQNVLQPTLRIIAEAGWITVVYSAASVMIDKHAPVLGPLEIFAFVLVGALIGRFGRPRLDLGPLLLIAGVVIGGIVGWLASPEVRDVLPTVSEAARLHIAGWIAGVAVLRGAIVDTGEKAAEDLEKLLRTVPVGLALIWAYMAIAADRSLWLSFAVGAMWGTLAFLSSAIVSIGLARLNVLHFGLADEQQRRGWRWLVIAIGFVIVPIAVPIAVLSGIPLAALVTPVVGPFQLPARSARLPVDGHCLGADSDLRSDRRASRPIPRRAPEADGRSASSQIRRKPAPLALSWAWHCGSSRSSSSCSRSSISPAGSSTASAGSTRTSIRRRWIPNAR